MVSRAVGLLVKTKPSRGVKDLSAGVIRYSYLGCHGTSRKVLTTRVQLKPKTALVSDTLRNDGNSRREQYSWWKWYKVINGRIAMGRRSIESTYLRRQDSAYLSTKTSLCHFEALHRRTGTEGIHEGLFFEPSLCLGHSHLQIIWWDDMNSIACSID